MADDHAVDIAELKTKVDNHSETFIRFGKRLDKNEEEIIHLRENMAQVATRDDVAELRTAVQTQFFKQLSEARDSIPGKVAAICGVITMLIGIAGYLAGHGGI
ncbi:hypothetical protein [Burkholderia multivorans]|uniref:hypothetical protein n=1 Tax=Burkholderia multivorans TaxID=87883 RepID=UPI001C257DEB|nr:hypothetical protein [Burkholderia multivorans]MBU9552822.1 hypothetical protein [Burkholderia multivorans]